MGRGGAGRLPLPPLFSFLLLVSGAAGVCLLQHQGEEEALTVGVVVVLLLMRKL